ncbi:PREDICTED: uncharacterized protein LOC104606812 [Nelumbo nucifera]|uniref:Uncharacterized protein LOC104606812 n=1 Tax=Nelumbo nucifera TaxID=4432 RepID=A0A1U8ARG3_NELNU|nr:PREDICTED: uncharacterized protein LOC104606812 [Nelumbo nucifera]XP_010270488.1 PREDICTED: uncharacterized protein LOC104606812 [Nelumbo nucifera]XP_010270489.1 PREDICTED: uncharacterized protein LOC104606812 [Nelumbo nucifera]XP_010270490.1 PREDICTED: uncharacterized protein LOC104606812 [Nelumbo nucifera]
MEEFNVSDINQLDTDVRLPPRKRLLAGLKKQSLECTSPPSSFSSISNDFSTRLRNLLSSDSKKLCLSPEEIVDASRSAALAAAKVAAAAKAAAEEKAAVAAKAAAAAKSALELVASVSEKTACKEKCLRSNKPKKHVPVNLLYKNHQPVEYCETDEELARQLHRAMNSSPRISKNSLSSDWKAHNHNNHGKQSNLEKTRLSNGGMHPDRNPPTCDRNSGESEVDNEGSTLEVDKLDVYTSECTKAICSEMDTFPTDGEAQANYAKEKNWRTLEDKSTCRRKRGRIKQKKLSLSLCTIKDRENLKDIESKGVPLGGEPEDKCDLRNVPLFVVEPHIQDENSVEAISVWKCNEFKAPQCFEESKIMQSLCSSPRVTTGSTMVEFDK